MALGDSYATLAALRDRMSIPDGDTRDDVRFSAALATATRGINATCHRQFNLAAVASMRLYRPEWDGVAEIDDVATAVGVIVETGDATGTTWTVWDTDDYELEPLNGLRDGEPGWPFYQLRAVAGRGFTCARRATLRVTAVWGWAAVPQPITEACEIMAQEIANLKDATFGIVGSQEFGEAMRIGKQSPRAMAMLAPFTRDPVPVG